MKSHNAVAACPRCGIRRQLGKNRDALCRSCYEVEPTWPDIPTQPEWSDHA